MAVSVRHRHCCVRIAPATGRSTVGLEGDDLVIRQGDQMLSLGELDGSFSRTLSFAWASNNTIFLVHTGGIATLLSVAPAG